VRCEQNMRSTTKIKKKTGFVTGEPTVGEKKRNRQYLSLMYVLAVWHVLSCSLHMVTVDECFSTDVLLSPVGKCLIQEMSSELILRFLSNLRNPQWKLVYYWLRLTVKIVCLVHAFLKGTNNFQMAGKVWKMTT